MKRTQEITIIQYRQRRLKVRQEVIVQGCSVCESDSPMITVADAASLTGLSRSTLYKWMGSQQIHTTRSSIGQLLVCRRSLLMRLTAVTNDP
jgi:hypothetical protein